MEGERGSVLYVGGLTLHIRTNWVVGRGPCTRQWLRPPLREHWCGRAATGIKRAPTPPTVTLVHPLSHPSSSSSSSSPPPPFPSAVLRWITRYPFYQVNWKKAKKTRVWGIYIWKEIRGKAPAGVGTSGASIQFIRHRCRRRQKRERRKKELFGPFGCCLCGFIRRRSLNLCPCIPPHLRSRNRLRLCSLW